MRHCRQKVKIRQTNPDEAQEESTCKKKNTKKKGKRSKCSTAAEEGYTNKEGGQKRST